jgi:(p)ppGpp synthase/HD superfamily hydrolase
MIESIIIRARNFAVNAHRSTNHLYDGQPYENHLEMVVNNAAKFMELITSNYSEVIAACWLHDTVEDCRVTYNDIKKEFGYCVAELVFAVTNEKGRTRKDRANANFYKCLVSVPDAPYVKICDRLANIQYSSLTVSKMLSAYRKEAEIFKQYLWNPRLQPMFDEMEIILFSTNNTTAP